MNKTELRKHVKEAYDKALLTGETVKVETDYDDLGFAIDPNLKSTFIKLDWITGVIMLKRKSHTRKVIIDIFTDFIDSFINN